MSPGSLDIPDHCSASSLLEHNAFASKCSPALQACTAASTACWKNHNRLVSPHGWDLCSTIIQCADCRLVEDADLRSAEELFGGAAISLDDFTPKSAKEFEQLGRTVAAKYLAPHAKSAHYKSLLKALLKEALASLEIQQVKDIETSVAGIRADKVKEDKAKQTASKGKTRNDKTKQKGAAAAVLPGSMLSVGHAMRWRSMHAFSCLSGCCLPDGLCCSALCRLQHDLA